MGERKQTVFSIVITFTAVLMYFMTPLFWVIGFVIWALSIILVVTKHYKSAVTIWSAFLLVGFVTTYYVSNTIFKFQMLTFEIISIATFVALVATIHIWQKSDYSRLTVMFGWFVVILIVPVFFHQVFYWGTYFLQIYFY